MNGDVYKISELELQEVKADGDSTVIVYRPPVESLHFSPGVLVKQHGDDVLVTVVRCNIKQRCSVDVEGELEGGSIRVAISAPRGKVRLTDGNEILEIGD